jgi:hypothetical protein
MHEQQQVHARTPEQAGERRVTGARERAREHSNKIRAGEPGRTVERDGAAARAKQLASERGLGRGRGFGQRITYRLRERDGADPSSGRSTSATTAGPTASSSRTTAGT